MKITNDLIKSLNPCESRFNNYLEHYKGKSHTIQQFLRLKNITQNDKLWVAFRLMPSDNIRLAAADIAESTLSIYEARFPGDLRPRKAIEAARSGNDIDAAYAACAAYAAAYVARAAADAACAAYAAAYVARAAAYAADAADAAYAACAAAYAACAAAYVADAAYNRSKQEKLILKIILSYWKE